MKTEFPIPSIDTLEITSGKVSGSFTITTSVPEVASWEMTWAWERLYRYKAHYFVVRTVKVPVFVFNLASCGSLPFRCCRLLDLTLGHWFSGCCIAQNRHMGGHCKQQAPVSAESAVI